MALSIKNTRTEELARRLAAATGESITEAITRALHERLERETGRSANIDWDAVRRIQEQVAALPVLDPRSAGEISDELWADVDSSA